ncbi:MBL fold metallo-hydrolase [Glycocaulis profundi]|nr:MBL fold metallo-hydrolase [Glycocaulis profundi]
MSIPFVHAFDFAYGRADRVSPLLTRIVADNPGPFTQAGTNSYIVGAGDEVALIDPGPALPAHEAALERALEGKRLAGVFLTHAHADHSPLSRPLAHRHGCPILAFPFASGAAQGDGPTMEAGIDPDFRVDVALEDGMVRRGPDWTLTAIHTPGHASNHVCFALAEETALICGDHVMGWATSVVIPPDGDMTDYLASLARVRAMDFARLWPAHGPSVDDPAPFLDAYIAHRHAREDQIRAILRDGPAAIPQMVDRMYQGLDPRLKPAAAISVLAHMIGMVGRGEAACEGAPGVESVYTLA